MPDFKIDRKNQTFVYDDGEVLPIPKSQVREVLKSKHSRGLQAIEKKHLDRTKAKNMLIPEFDAASKSFKGSLLGNLGQQGADYVRAGIGAFTPGEGQEELSIVDRVVDNFNAYQDAYKSHLGEESEEYPISSGIGKGLGIAGEIAATGKLPATVQMPLMGAAHSETSFLDAGQKAKEVGKDALQGFVLDKFFGAISKTAAARGERKAAQGKIDSIKQANVAETQAAEQATQADATRFTTEKAAMDAEMAALPGRQAAENQAFQASTAQRVDKLAKAVGKTPINTSVLGVEEFVEDTVGRSALAGSAEGNWASRFMKSIFKGDKQGKISGESLKKGFTALDEAIVAQEGPIKQMLIDYRTNLIENLPSKMTNSYIVEKWGDKFYKNLTGDVGRSLELATMASPDINNHLVKKLGKNYFQTLDGSVKGSIREILEKHKGNFFEALESGVIQQEVETALANNPMYLKMRDTIDNMYAVSNLDKATARHVFPEYNALERTFTEYPQRIIDKMNTAVKRDLPKIQYDQYLKASEIEHAVSPIPRQPNVLPQPAPVAQAQTTSPNLQPVPEMPQGQGLYGRLAQGLEAVQSTKFGDVIKGAKQVGAAGAVGQIAGAPVYKTAATLASGAKLADFATRPGAIPESIRQMVKQGSVQALEQLAQQYPSYHDGVLDNPLDRRSLTKQIEDTQDMPIELKAVYQSKVNRGIPLGGKL